MNYEIRDKAYEDWLDGLPLVKGYEYSDYLDDLRDGFNAGWQACEKAYGL